MTTTDSQTIDILKQIVAIPSYVDGSQNESQLIDFIKKTLSVNPKLKVVEQPVEGERRNLIVTEVDNPKILLFGHMDTVLPKQQEKDPLDPYEENGNLYGLGAVDMKSGLSIMLDIALNHHQSNIGYIFSVDEEFDFKGAMKLKEVTTLKPEYIINVEPTDLHIIQGCRGITEFDFEVWGKSAHAGTKTLGVNAIEKALELTRLFEEACTKTDTPDVKSSVNLAHIVGGIKTGEGSEVKRMGNIVPNYTKLVLEIRIGNQSITKDFVVATLKDLASTLGISISEPNFKFYLGSMFTPKSELKELEESIKECGFPVIYDNINETGYFELEIIQSHWGGKGIVFGAGPGKMAHMANEYVNIQSVSDAKKILLSYLGQLIG